MLKYSRQRECIKNFLMNRNDHPTAETVYFGIKEEFPNVSLGTVYRNLSLLSERGDIIKISTIGGPDRFDGNVAPHYHFFCSECNRIIDLDMDIIDHINIVANHDFDGKIDGHITHFYGKCSECLNTKD